ncbi:Hypothetical protein HDN1F_19580 [gamma proteobacterium HdN1]|nr:Hypothetical protein HDN1F_19580 [gamma proteobacterium HdN1]
MSEPDNSAWRLYRIRGVIKTDPEYQRASDIWTDEKKQLLIDTILNGFDVPKMYFHKFSIKQITENNSCEYAVIDGKQRLEAIWDFIEGRFALAEDFECLWDNSLVARGMTYSELGKDYPDLKNALDSYPLTIVCIETDDIEIIEDMFSRLNEAVPLSAAEKRNAKGGPVPNAIKLLVASQLFTDKVVFGNSRYRHYDLAAKFLLSVDKGKILETKKRTLDSYVLEWAEKADRNDTLPFFNETMEILSNMAAIFADRDKLLRQVGNVVLYFHLFRVAYKQNWTADIQRQILVNFENERIASRMEAERGGPLDPDFVEFDRYAQSSNDASAVKIRLKILLRRAFSRDTTIESL